MGAANQIAQLGSHQWRVPAGVLGDDQVVPDSVQRILLPAQQVQAQLLDLIGPSRHRAQGRQLLAGSSQPVPGFAPKGAPHQYSALLQFAQRNFGTG